MLTEVQNDILTVLDNLGVFKECDVWQGDLDSLLKQVQKTPSAHVALASGQFARPRTMGDTSPMMRMGWDVIVIYQCLKGRKVSSTQGYGLVEAITKPVGSGGLSGFKTQGGQLWPVSLELIDTIGGITAYAINFDIERNIL